MYKIYVYNGEGFLDTDDLKDYVFDFDNVYNYYADSFDESIDDRYGSINIAGNTHWASTILYEHNENKYCEEKDEFIHEKQGDMINDYTRDINNLEIGGQIYVSEFDETIKCVDLDGDNDLSDTEIEELRKEIIRRQGLKHASKVTELPDIDELM